MVEGTRSKQEVQLKWLVTLVSRPRVAAALLAVGLAAAAPAIAPEVRDALERLVDALGHPLAP